MIPEADELNKAVVGAVTDLLVGLVVKFGTAFTVRVPVLGPVTQQLPRLARAYMVNPVLVRLYGLVVGNVVTVFPEDVSQYILGSGALYEMTDVVHAGVVKVRVPVGVAGAGLTTIAPDTLLVIDAHGDAPPTTQ